MSFGRQVLHGAVFATVWIVLTRLITDSVTHDGANLALGLSRSQLFIVGTFLGGLIWPLIYYVTLGMGRNKNTPRKAASRTL